MEAIPCWECARAGDEGVCRGCIEGHAECVEALCCAGADVNVGLPSGVTPLFICCQLGHLRIAQILSLHGARRVFEIYEYGMAGFRRRRQVRTAEEQVRLSEEQGFTSEGSRPELLEWLIKSRHFCTPLHHLEMLSKRRALELLHEGADLHAVSGHGAPSPLDLAMVQPEGPVARLLLRASLLWTPANAQLYPLDVQRFARSLLWLGAGLASSFSDLRVCMCPGWMSGLDTSCRKRSSGNVSACARKGVAWAGSETSQLALS